MTGVPTGRIVLTVHGIETDAKWQKSVTPVLNSSGFVVLPYDYGRFRVIAFALRRARDAAIAAFRDYYERIISDKRFDLDPDDPRKRPSVVAHSFGTYIVGHCLRRHPSVRFDKIILCGSILDPLFDWSELFARDQATHVRNLCCQNDRWVRRARFLVRDAGASGVSGFQYWGTLVESVKRPDCRHSDFFTDGDVREGWLDFLRRPTGEYRIEHSRNIAPDDRTSLLNAANRIDNEVYSEYPEYSPQEIPRGLSTRWLRSNGDIYVFVFTRKSHELAGYIDAMPVTDACYESILAGDKPDPAIEERDVVPYEANAALSLYLMSIAVDPRLRNDTKGLDSEALERLINGLVSKLMHYATQHDVRVRRMAAVGWTEIGCKMCDRLGMRVQPRRSKEGKPIYAIDFDTAPRSTIRLRHPGLRRLLVEYDRVKAARA